MAEPVWVASSVLSARHSSHRFPGLPASLTGVVFIVSWTSMADQTLHCPKCWLTDRVHRLPSLYASGPSTGRTDVNIAGQPPLNRRLAPPPRPAKPRVSGVPVALAAVALLVGGVSLTIGLWDKSSQLGTPEYGAIVAAGRALVLAGILALAVAAFFVTSVIPGYLRNRRRFRLELSRWERKMEVWNRLCYCTRDQVLFLPGNRESLRPEQLHALLSRPDLQAASARAYSGHR